MILDILQTIINNSKFKDQIMCSQINKYLHNNMNIFSLKCSSIISQKIIEQPIFKKLKILNCKKGGITNVNHLKHTLEVFHCGGYYSKITQNGISELYKIKILNCGNNRNITNVNHIGDTLEELKCVNSSGIDQFGISKLKCLRKLNCNFNKNISNVNHLKYTLEELRCASLSKNGRWILGETYSNCSLSQTGISDLKKLRILDCSGNEFIKDVNHLKETLRELYCRENICGLDQKGISDLKKIEILDCGANGKIKSVNHLSNSLEKLICCYDRAYYLAFLHGSNFGIDQNGISELRKLKKIDCWGNQKILSLNHLASTLEELDCGGECGVDQNGISHLRLKILICENNYKIISVNHMAETLQVLYCMKKCGIDQDGIRQLKKLQVMKCAHNVKIEDVNCFTDTLEILDCYGNDTIKDIYLPTNLIKLNCTQGSNLHINCSQKNDQCMLISHDLNYRIPKYDGVIKVY